MILHLRRQEPAKALIFKAGLSLGVAVLFSPTLTPILLGPWIALAIFRPFVWREWLMLLLGFVLPHLYHAAIYFLATGKYMVELTGLTLGDSELNLSAIELSNWIFFGLLVLYSIWKLLVIRTTSVVRYKKQTLLLFHMTWLLSISLIIEWFMNGHLLLAVLIPLSIFISIQFLNARKMSVVNIVLLIWFIISGVNLYL